MVDSAYSLFEVFGTGRSVPASYVPRENIDARFLNYLSEDKHTVIHGPSGQGKTMLIKRHLTAEQYRVVQCSNYHRRIDIYRMILGEADASVSLETRIRKGKRLAATISFLSGGTESNSEISTKIIDIDLGNINDVIRALRERDFDKYIVLEDFHYLRKKVQKEILNDLKIVSDKSGLRFIFIGIWLQKDKFLHLNGNLSGKINSIRVSPWTEPELREVIDTGESMLNVSFAKDVKAYLLSHSFGSVSILQELIYLTCNDLGILETRGQKLIVNSLEDVARANNYMLERHSVRLKNFIMKYAYRDVYQIDHYIVRSPGKHYLLSGQGVVDYRGDNINKWIMLAVFNFLSESGLTAVSIDELERVIDKLRDSDLSKLDRYELIRRAKRISRRQRKVNIHPLVFSFDNEKEVLHVVDNLFLYYCSSEQGKTTVKELELIPDNQREYNKYQDYVRELVDREREEKNKHDETLQRVPEA